MENKNWKGREMNKNRMVKIIIVALITMILVVACGNQESQKTIRVGSKEFTEQLILGNMYEIVLNNAGYKAEYHNLAGTNEAHEALVNGEIDLYPEYTGTALLTQLGKTYDSSMSIDDVYQTVKSEYQQRWNLTWLEPTSFNNTYCIAMQKDLAEQMGIQTLSQLSENADQLVFGTVAEFPEREDGLVGLQKVYGGFNFKDIVILDPGLKYAGLREGEIDVTTCFGTDGEISTYNLVVLQDDLNFWPPYPVSAVVRTETLDEYPEIATLLDEVDAHLDGETMSRLNWEVTGNNKEADEVAHDFLVEVGLID
jgi:osmoprotectant transport system substrate-binding protein